MSRCEHGRTRYSCRDCKTLGIGGKGICEHNRERSRCRECGGTGVCEHGRRRRECTKCGGTGVCEHGQRRNRCIKCVGGSVCKHSKKRSKCRECCGGSICEHNKERSKCGVCRPQEIYQRYRTDALSRELSFSITIDDFKSIISQPCYLCGESETSRGIDRWNNKIGYEVSNCRPCCGPHNMMKGTLDISKFVDLCISVADHVRAVESERDAFPEELVP
jgi:hypothetical protein